MKRIVYTIVLIAFVFTAFIMAKPVYRLCLTDPLNDEIVKSFPAKNGERFTIRFIHSVERTPWIEKFEIINDSEIYLRETVTFSFGAGLPTYSENFSFEEEGMTISDIDEKMDHLIYKVGGVIAHHTLVYRGKNYYFEDYIDHFKSIGVKVVSGPLYRFLLKEVT
jgi:hypothetical protein